jgi:hypothetical protein
MVVPLRLRHGKGRKPQELGETVWANSIVWLPQEREGEEELSQYPARHSNN